jgi:hypothetical protein
MHGAFYTSPASGGNAVTDWPSSSVTQTLPLAGLGIMRFHLGPDDPSILLGTAEAHLPSMAIPYTWSS